MGNFLHNVAYIKIGENGKLRILRFFMYCTTNFGQLGKDAYIKKIAYIEIAYIEI